VTPRHHALITGAAGQDGILLARLLTDNGYKVFGYVRPGSHRLPLLQRLAPEVQIIAGDIADRAAFEAALHVAGPREVYNLAGLSSVAKSWDNAAEVMAINAQAVVGLLDGVRAYGHDVRRDVRFYQASSSEMFGRPSESPQTEATAFRPVSPYGVSKVAAHLLTVNYRESHGMYACSGILYNHESSLRGPSFVTRKISMGVAAIATGHSTTLELGRLDVERDWGYAPDYVKAMWMMLQAKEPRDYVIATGQSHSLSDFLDVAFGSVGIDDWSELVRSDIGLVRPAEVADLVGDASNARLDLGWSPTIGFEEIVEQMVVHDLGRLKGKS
jgi:GDPmannose 4,6-dehydratase